MAREEHPKENLLRDATALVERLELRLDGVGDAILVGFRRDRSPSIYWTQAEVYQFSAANQLRRGFLVDRLIKAEEGRLFWLDRQRDGREIVLRRTPFTEVETADYRARFRKRAVALIQALEGIDAAAETSKIIVGQVPADVPLVARCLQWLTALRHPVTIANSPRVGG
jgi:hypothetical protein